jgi:hypothetical protein
VRCASGSLSHLLAASRCSSCWRALDKQCRLRVTRVARRRVPGTLPAWLARLCAPDVICTCVAQRRSNAGWQAGITLTITIRKFNFVVSVQVTLRRGGMQRCRGRQTLSGTTSRFGRDFSCSTKVTLKLAALERKTDHQRTSAQCKPAMPAKHLRLGTKLRSSGAPVPTKHKTQVLTLQLSGLQVMTVATNVV